MVMINMAVVKVTQGPGTKGTTKGTLMKGAVRMRVAIYRLATGTNRILLLWLRRPMPPPGRQQCRTMISARSASERVMMSLTVVEAIKTKWFGTKGAGRMITGTMITGAIHILGTGRYHDHRTSDDDSKHSDNNISYRSYRDKETGRSIPRAQGTRHRDDSDLEVRDNSEKDWKEGGLKPDKKRRLNDTNKDGEQRKKEKGKVETAKMKAKSNDPDDDEITISDVERSFEFEGRIVGKTLKEADYDEKKPRHKKRHKKRQRHQSRRKRRNYSSSD